MKKTLLTAAALAVAPLSPAFGASDTDAIEADERTIETSRPVAVILPQDRIETLIELGRIAPLFADGFLTALVVNSMDDRQERLTENAQTEAEETAAPLFAALEGFDVAGLALQTTDVALASPDWFKAAPASLFPMTETSTIADFAAANPAEELALATYQYQLSPDCTQLRVVADLKLVDREGLSALYNQQIVSLVRLDRPSYVCDENVAQWADNGGALAKAALGDAFSRLEAVIPQVLALDDAAFEEATDKDRESAFGGGFYGPLLFRDERGPVIWQRKTGFIAIQVAQLPEPAAEPEPVAKPQPLAASGDAARGEEEPLEEVPDTAETTAEEAAEEDATRDAP
ncbi:hypothetical protein [Alteraurantiacibacter aquimixticola]|uniref:Uncharacterized protein n=1 Tax=Alteraurantiacibacter aquimixticola TaxID=2489173 RepID=A0A4T3F2G8_9SPHN|nr:hypothetical protein [Alteraurantiacibacter aquimixticola]TIX51308.1 hypothetical protein E5222_02260 [Alteraurantiacibacter aquimixticola]